MTFPAASFTAVAPPADGLALAFGAARRRRNSKAAVSAFGGAVAIASVLSFLAPPGQSLVQEPAQPAHGGAVLTGLPDAPRQGAPTSPVRTSVTQAPPLGLTTTAGRATRLTRSAPARSSAVTPRYTCSNGQMLACVVFHSPAAGGPTMHARVCPAAATVTVEYDAPPVGPTRFSASRTVEVGSCHG